MEKKSRSPFTSFSTSYQFYHCVHLKSSSRFINGSSGPWATIPESCHPPPVAIPPQANYGADSDHPRTQSQGRNPPGNPPPVCASRHESISTPCDYTCQASLDSSLSHLETSFTSTSQAHSFLDPQISLPQLVDWRTYPNPLPHDPTDIGLSTCDNTFPWLLEASDDCNSYVDKQNFQGQ